MATSRYSIAFIFLLNIFFSLGIALYTAQAEAQNSPVIDSAITPVQTLSTPPTTYLITLNEITQIIVTLPE
jgi:hypothetical protein